MLYHAYEASADSMASPRAFAEWAASVLARSKPAFEQSETRLARNVQAACEVFARARLTHTRPAFGIASVTAGGREVAVIEEKALVMPFGTLLRFRRDIAVEQPRVLIVAPMSGHFATLLRDTVRVMLADHDVYITDWESARDVPLTHGRFGLDEYVQHLIRFLEAIGPAAHVVAICQPCAAAIAATAIMAEDGNPAQPRSLTLMAGPIDTRINPTEVNRLATSRSMAWFERNLIYPVPARHPGAGRLVYPGFLQLAAFMSMNLERHRKAFADLYKHLSKSETEKAAAIRAFYDEYFAVADLPAEFYLETVREIFQEHALPRGALTWGTRRVDPRAIRRTTLLTVEGERDDICSIGQTLAAHDLMSSLPPYMKSHHMQAGVGHYGVFHGRHWNHRIYPVVRDCIYVSGA